MKKIFWLFLLIIWSVSCQENKKHSAENSLQQKDTVVEVLPVLKVTTSEYTSLESKYFKTSTGKLAIKEKTLVAVKYDSVYLEIKFECWDNPRVHQNFYTKNNEPLYNQEAFEVFIHKGKESSKRYLEVQINSNNALFLANIDNTNNDFATDYLNPDLQKVLYKTSKDRINQMWKGSIKIPYKIIQSRPYERGDVFRVNFFRIISNLDHTDRNWKNTLETATYASWSATLTETPQFHIPNRFGYLVFE